jgi:hypothetical protein
MLRRISAIGGAAGDVDDPSSALLAEVEHGEAAQLRRGNQVDVERPLPLGEPLPGRQVDRRRLEDAGIVDQHVDSPAEPLQRLPPEPLRRPRFGEVGGDSAGAAPAGVAGDLVAGERLDDRLADAPAGAGDENVEPGHAAA